jgi:hypothetical protein
VPEAPTPAPAGEQQPTEDQTPVVPE